MPKRKASPQKRETSPPDSGFGKHGQSGLMSRMLDIADESLEGVKQPGNKRAPKRRG
jgi:hypothetical protein